MKYKVQSSIDCGMLYPLRYVGENAVSEAWYGTLSGASSYVGTFESNNERQRRRDMYASARPRPSQEQRGQGGNNTMCAARGDIHDDSDGNLPRTEYRYTEAAHFVRHRSIDRLSVEVHSHDQ